MRSLSIAATGMQAQQLNLDVISNNIANLSTSAFKRQRADFVDLLYQTKTRMGTNSAADGTVIPTGIQLGLGVKAGSTYRINEQGPIVNTDNPLDLAINGRGFFQIQMPSGEIAYTRAGQFNLNADGEIVNPQGHLLLPGFTVPQDAVGIDISEDGQVQATFSDQVAPQILGQIEIATFINDAGLSADGNNLYKETEASGPPLLNMPLEPGYGAIRQRFIEQSNVDAVTEITTLITAQRGFELNSRVVSTSDEMLQTISNIR